jgi:phasin family protein
MAKTNVNTASRDELVEAGIRADLADEILKLRRKGKITSADALEEVHGVGPATLEQLRKVLDFSEKSGNGEAKRGEEGQDAKRDEQPREPERAERARPQEREEQPREREEQPREPARVARQVAETASSIGRESADTAREVASAGAQAATNVARGGLQLLQRTADAVDEVEREVLDRSTKGVTQLSELFVDLIGAQSRHNVETLAALTRAVRYDALIQIQSDFLRASMERMAEFSRRYMEMTQQVMSSATAATQDRERRDRRHRAA